jgi:hypothetical protein
VSPKPESNDIEFMLLLWLLLALGVAALLLLAR